jgi:hypothetical protein
MLATDLMYAIPTIILAFIFILIAMIEYPIFTIGMLGAIILELIYGGGNAIVLGGTGGAALGWVLSKSRQPSRADEFHKRYFSF